MEAKEKWDQLTEQHRGQLLERHRVESVHDEWWDDVYEVFKEDMSAIGVHVETIYFSGFWSQGDGACFEGCWHYSAGCVKAVKDYAPQDTDLHSIAKALRDASRKVFYTARARVVHSGRYYHECSVSIDIESETRCAVVWNAWNNDVNIPDLGAGNHVGYLCVERGDVADHAVSLPPGGSYRAWMSIAG